MKTILYRYYMWRAYKTEDFTLMNYYFDKADKALTDNNERSK